jgi:molybdenum cofactor cytidylyltransferase
MSDLSVIEVSADAADGDSLPPDATHVHGLLLAAGTSSRFGERNKLLATVEGEPVVRHAARSLLGAKVDAITVVVGHEHERVRDALADLVEETALSGSPTVRFVRAPDYAEGQSRSLRRGIEAIQHLDQTADAVVIALGDMPDVSPATVDCLIAAYEAGAGTALAAAYDGQRGNPVLFDAVHFDELTAIGGDTGGRSVLLTAEDAALVETGDPGVVRDVDRPEDVAENDRE